MSNTFAHKKANKKNKKNEERMHERKWSDKRRKIKVFLQTMDEEEIEDNGEIYF